MTLENSAYKISQAAFLSPEEFQEFTAFLIQTQGTNAKVGLMASGQGSVTSLDQITPEAGRIYGEFIARASPEMFDPTASTFTGVVMFANGITIGGVVYNLCGILNGVVQWGANTTNASLTAGAGAVTMDGNGISIIAQTTKGSTRAYKFIDSTGDLLSGVYGLTTGVVNNMEISTESVTGKQSNVDIYSRAPTGQTSSIGLTSFVNGNIVSSFNVSEQGVRVTGGDFITNPNNGNYDTILNGDTVEVARVDASADSFGIGTATPSAKLEVTGTMKQNGGAVDINSGQADFDTTIYGDNRAVAIVDAGLDTLQVSKLNLIGGAILTIATGAVTVTHSRHRLDTEGAAATDDLDTINGGNDGDILVLGTSNNARDVVVKHNTGNIVLNGSADFTLDNARDTLTLLYRGALSLWVELSRSNNS